MPRLLALLLVLCLGACRTQPLDFDGGVPGADLAGGGGSGGGGGGGGSPRDMRGARDLSGSPISCCGVAGNPGNEQGVGKFCEGSVDCASQQANICATTFAPNLTFCTKACSMTGSANQCGSGAQCQCAQSQCACIPGECVMPPPGC